MTGDEFTALAQRHMDLVYRVALNCVKHPSDADDVTQNVMLRLFRSGPRFESEEHARRWLIRVTANESKRLLSMTWRSRTASLEEAVHAVHPEDEERQELLRAVIELPDKYRLPLYLYYYEGYSTDEIAAILNSKLSTVQTWLARGREKLKSALKGGN